MKQSSTNTRTEIGDQFEEIKTQFQNANKSKEGMLMVFDWNVHVGSSGIKGCKDKEDWGGKLVLKMISEENLVLLNSTEICSGIVTRIDPRNGGQSTLDLAICNQFMKEKGKGIYVSQYKEWGE